MENDKFSRTLRAKELGISRQSLYYRQKKPPEDWLLKCRIEEVLRTPGKHSYGSRRIALDLKLNRKGVKRVMNHFGIKPYRRRLTKWKKTKNIKVIYPNLLLTTFPQYENHIWVSDFTRIKFYDKIVYVCTVEDLFTRKIAGVSVYTTHAVQLTISALMNALQSNSRPVIFHCDNGSEYDAEIFVRALETVGIQISRSAPGCPWENGYQESFYDKFKIDLGDPNRFKNIGELVYEIYHQIYIYNNIRIHGVLKMSPVQFAEKVRLEYN